MKIPVRSLCTWLLCASLALPEDSPPRVYGVESGILEIEKTFENQVMSSSEKQTVYFSDWGNVLARETTLTTDTHMGPKTVKRLYSLKRGGFLTIVNLETLEGTQMKDAGAGVDGASAREAARKMKESMGAQIEALEAREIAGKTCSGEQTRLEIGGVQQVTRTWTWKDIPFAVESTTPGTEVRELVTKASFDVEIPADKLTLPAGATVKEWEPSGR